MSMRRAQRIGTVEVVKVKSSGRRLYVNLDADFIAAFGIEAGDLLKVEIKEKVTPEDESSHEPHGRN